MTLLDNFGASAKILRLGLAVAPEHPLGSVIRLT